MLELTDNEVLRMLDFEVVERKRIVMRNKIRKMSDGELLDMRRKIERKINRRFEYEGFKKGKL